VKIKHENRFLPSYFIMYGLYAVIGPYLAIMVRGLGYSPLWIGILFGVYEGIGLTGPFVFGYWADKTGNYRYALTTAVLLPAFAIFPLITWVHPLLSALFLALMAFGLRGSITLIDALTTIQIGNTGNYGRIRVWGSFGFILFSLFFQWTPFLKLNSPTNISLWIVIISVASAVPFFVLPAFALKASVHSKNGEKPEEKMIPIFSFYVVGTFLIIFLGRFSIAALHTYFPLYMVEILKWDAVGLMFAIAALSEIPFFFMSFALIRRFGPVPLLALAAGGTCVRLLILAFLPFKGVIIFSQLLNSVTMGMFHPAFIYFIASIFPSGKRGRGMSVFMALGASLPLLIGNMAGGAVIEAYGYQSFFVIYAAVTGCAVLLYVIMRRVLVHPDSGKPGKPTPD